MVAFGLVGYATFGDRTQGTYKTCWVLILLHIMNIMNIIKISFVFTLLNFLRWFVGKLLLKRPVNQLIKIDVFANNAVDVPTGMYGDQSRCRSDP